ncbi:hypothetical protein EZS27_016625 [termite gut metagenome]|uniref:Uncharacterized protein n=1 Tax=termite gut metagenome TaxID=433724 RepID=A0A5J4RLU7_9ZZZZ
MNELLLELNLNPNKTSGKQTEFASLFGWSPQCLVKLLKGENFGLQPVFVHHY